ncbi:MAG: hypothetical protein ACE144_02250 [Thermodesulfobacteriota bacterium]
MNRNNYIRSVLVIFASVLAFASQTLSYDGTDFSAAGRKWQSAPEGHKPGKDNGPGIGTHNVRADCGICHSPKGKADNYIFTMSGTLYEDRMSRKPMKNGEVILEDSNGKVISMTTNEVGNFWTYAAIGSHPLAIASHSGKTVKLYSSDPEGNLIPAPSHDSRTWLYKTWVRTADQVRPMVTIAPVGGSTDGTSRMSCNMHHGALAARGALWGSEKSTLSSYPSSNLRFKKHILPILKNKCVPCHIPGDTWTRMVTRSDYEGTSKIDYSSGLDITSYGGSKVSVGGVLWEKIGIQSVVSTEDPDSSPLLLKTKKGATHGGGWFWGTQDDDYKAIRQWIKEGAQNK